FAQFLHVDDGAQAATDQPLDFLSAAGLLALCGLTAAPGVRGTRQHRVFGCDPAFTLAAEKWRYLLLDGGSHQHAGVPEGNQRRTLRMPREAGLNIDSAHLVGRAAGRSHEDSSCELVRSALAE